MKLGGRGQCPLLPWRRAATGKQQVQVQNNMTRDIAMYKLCEQASSTCKHIMLLSQVVVKVDLIVK